MIAKLHENSIFKQFQSLVLPLIGGFLKKIKIFLEDINLTFPCHVEIFLRKMVYV